jgi:transcriptional regulator with XRE-family HTH domain
VIAPPLSLVPPRRLGALLADRRRQSGRSLDDIASSSPFTATELATLEAGDRPLDDATVTAVLAAYGVEPDAAVPSRTELVVDLDEGRIIAGSRSSTVDAPTADEVLASYLSLVYTMRNAEPGTPLVLRDADVDVLSRALDLTQVAVERRLHDLMAEPTAAVRGRVGGLRARVLVPIVGVVVAVTAVGALVLVARSDDGQPAPAPAPAVATADDQVQLGPSSVQTPDDGQVVQGEGIPADELPPGAVNLGEAQTAVRNPDGSVSQFPTPTDDGTPQP